MPSLEYRELLSKREIFDQKAATSAKQTDDCAETKPKQGEHHSDIAELSELTIDRNFLILKPSSILARHNREVPCGHWAASLPVVLSRKRFRNVGRAERKHAILNVPPLRGDGYIVNQRKAFRAQRTHARDFQGIEGARFSSGQDLLDCPAQHFLIVDTENGRLCLPR
jgi:hypothetical protein